MMTAEFALESARNYSYKNSQTVSLMRARTFLWSDLAFA